MAFDPNRNIVDDWYNNILRGVGVRVFDPLAENDRRLDFDDDDDDDEDEYGGERRPKEGKRDTIINTNGLHSKDGASLVTHRPQRLRS